MTNTTTTTAHRFHAAVRAFAHVALVALLSLAIGCALEFEEDALEYEETAFKVVPPACTPGPGQVRINVAGSDTTALAGGGFAVATDPHIYVGRPGALGDDRALMPVVTTPPSVIDAVLCLHVDQYSTPAHDVVAGQIDPFGGFVINALPPAPLVGGWNVVDVTPLVTDWVSGAYPNHGIGLREPGPGAAFSYSIRSANHAVVTDRPFLIVSL